MANSLSSVNPEVWAKEAERSLFVENKAMLVANTRFAKSVSGAGDNVDVQILSYPSIGTYTPGTDINTRALSSSQEQLSIATFFSSLMTIDDTEKKQSTIELVSKVAGRMMKNFNNRIEQAVTYEVYNATWS